VPGGGQGKGFGEDPHRRGKGISLEKKKVFVYFAPGENPMEKIKRGNARVYNVESLRQGL